MARHRACREHDGLRDPLTPNEKYDALVETAGYVQVPLSEQDYIELLPGCWRAINTCVREVWQRAGRPGVIRRFGAVDSFLRRPRST
jgi:hypothetical protein